MPRSCSVDDCQAAYYGRDLCKKHYERLRIRGTTDPDPTGRGVKIESDHCAVEGCGRLRHSGSRSCRARYCGAHLYRLRRFGDLRADVPVGGFGMPHASANPNWRGAAVSYGGAHRRVTRMRGPARLQSCVDCGEPARHWSYDHRDPNELCGSDSKPRVLYFSADIDHYEPRCTPCHKSFDLAYLTTR